MKKTHQELAPNSTSTDEAVTAPEYYVIIDNCKNSCCIDFISAAHVDCDFLVKFGDSCRADNLEKNIPVKYVYGEVHALELQNVKDRISELGNTGYVRILAIFKKNI